MSKELPGLSKYARKRSHTTEDGIISATIGKIGSKMAYRHVFEVRSLDVVVVGVEAEDSATPWFAGAGKVTVLAGGDGTKHWLSKSLGSTVEIRSFQRLGCGVPGTFVCKDAVDDQRLSGLSSGVGGKRNNAVRVEEWRDATSSEPVCGEASIAS